MPTGPLEEKGLAQSLNPSINKPISMSYRLGRGPLALNLDALLELQGGFDLNGATVRDEGIVKQQGASTDWVFNFDTSTILDNSFSS